MNKKEINEIKRIFSDDCGLFTVNHVVTAFVDSEKNSARPISFTTPFRRTRRS